MLVIADSSPLIVLIKLDYLDVLPKLFDRIVIPSTVARELQSDARPQVIREFMNKQPAWLEIETAKSMTPIESLHPGESEAIALAIDLHADLLLVDDRKAYRAAVARKINAIGTVRVLELAAEEGMLDLKTAFEHIKQTDFWISHDLLNQRLKLFEGRGH